MRLSESLKRNIMETGVGRLLNKFKIKSRRNVLFFEDILANYIRECEEAGYGEEMRNIAQRWMSLCIPQLAPAFIKKLSPTIFFNIILKNIWKNLGIMNDLRFSKKGNLTIIKTKSESITRIIGKNKFSHGSYAGVLGALFQSKIEYVDAIQSKKICKYTFKIKDVPLKIKAKKKTVYDILNQAPKLRGFSLKDVLETKLFQLKENNRIYFRGKPIVAGESTLFQLMDISNILTKRIEHISYNHFKNIIEKESSNTKKLVLLKTLLQTMGWGIIKIISNENEIVIEIKNPPYGFQLEKDTWNFLIRTILGYLWVINKDIKIKNIVSDYKYLKIVYSINKKLPNREGLLYSN